MNFCGLGSNFKNSSFHVGESSNTPLYLMKKNELEKGNDETCSYGLGHVSGDQATNEQATIDPKQQSRRLANRRSAQRSREKKQKYMTDLEEKERCLQANVTILKTRIEAMRRRNNQLQLVKNRWEEQMFSVALKTKIRQVRIDSTRFEIELMELENLQNARKRDEPDLTLSLALPGIRA